MSADTLKELIERLEKAAIEHAECALAQCVLQAAEKHMSISDTTLRVAAAIRARLASLEVGNG